MAVSRSLNDPVVIVTWVRFCAALTGCTAIASSSTNEMKKLKSFVFITSSDDWTFVERSDVNEIAQCRQARAVGSCGRVYLTIFPRRSEQRRELPAQLRRSSAP